MRLTPRQIEILILYARGFGPKEIAAELYIARATIQSHLLNIRAALGVHTTVQCIVMAVARGYMEIDQETESARAPAPASKLVAA